MVDQIDVSAKVLFGKQLMKYRLAAKLSRRKLGEFMGTDGSYIIKIETGEVNLGIDSVGKYAELFGVKIYEFLNPNFTIPSFEQMPEHIRHLKDNIKKYKADLPKQPRTKLAPFLDELLKTKFLKKPRTLTEIADALKAEVVVPHNKIAVLLGKHPRNKIVRTIPGEEWGGKVNKYVLI
ncbi:Transcriptional regulator, contains XRE-family HTH domain [bacterium A37T11]|nr:Transcriptional regulator, contains XRE-family HTH domain [bacterium A37T11]